MMLGFECIGDDLVAVYDHCTCGTGNGIDHEQYCGCELVGRIDHPDDLAILASSMWDSSDLIRPIYCTGCGHSFHGHRSGKCQFTFPDNSFCTCRETP